MSYNVVFEHSDTTNLYFGIRTWTDYRSPEYFSKNYKPTNIEKILEEGVSQDQALNLTSLTPEICRIAAAIEEAFTHGFSAGLFDYQYFNAKMAITHDRTHVLLNELVREPSGKIIDFFLSYTDKNLQKEDLKTKLLQSLLKHTNPYGQVNISQTDKDYEALLKLAK